MKGTSLDNKSHLFPNPTKKIFSSNYSKNKNLGSVSFEAEPSICNTNRHHWSGFWTQYLSNLGSSNSSLGKIDSKNCGSDTNGGNRKKSVGKDYYEVWRAAVRRVMMNGMSMRRILGFDRGNVSTSRSDIWLLGCCYRVSAEGDDVGSSDPTYSEGFAAFVEDFSSRILITYRKGFTLIGNTKYSSDVNWGCMLRSSQMLVAQAFLFHKFGRSWRKSPHKSLDQSYIELLHLFGDSDDSPCSIHNLLEAGKAYGLAPGSWIGPYATCRAWESLVRNRREESDNAILSSLMAIYVVSGDEDGERGGAPVLCIEDLCKHCIESQPILLMVPLVLGLDKINPRYFPLLSATFMFPQSVGIMGGRPGASTYIVGVQGQNAFYLDPHEVQQVVDIKRDDVDVDTSSYHSNVVRHIPLDMIDSSVAIGFYCRDKADVDDFCLRASNLIDQSNCAPLFTIAKTRSSLKPVNYQNSLKDNATEIYDHDLFDRANRESKNSDQEDDWQLL